MNKAKMNLVVNKLTKMMKNKRWKALSVNYIIIICSTHLPKKSNKNKSE